MAEEEDTSINDELAAAAVAAAILVDRYAIYLSREMLRLLDRLRLDLAAAVTAHDFSQPARTRDRQNRLAKLLEDAAILVRDAYRAIRDRVQRDLGLLADLSQQELAGRLGRAIGSDSFTPAPQERLNELTATQLIAGATIAYWLSKQAGDLRHRFETRMRDAQVRQLPLSDALDLLVGDSHLLAPSFSRLQTLIISATHAVDNAAATELYERYPQYIQAVQQISTIDDRTTVICRRYHRRVWLLPHYEPIGHNLPYDGGIPRHWNCRSRVVPVLVAWDNLPPRAKSRLAGQAERFDGQPAREPEAPPRDQRPLSLDQLRS